MKTGAGLKAVGAVALAASLIISALWVAFIPLSAAEEGVPEAPPVFFTLPDADPATPGTQMMPQPDDPQAFVCWIALPQGAEGISAVSVKIYYPNGSFMSEPAAEPVSDPAIVAEAAAQAITSDLLDQAIADLLQDASTAVYRAAAQLQPSDPAGHYRIEAWGTDTLGNAAPQAINSFEYLELKSCRVDFAALNFGRVMPGGEVPAKGSQTVQNVGNVPFRVEIRATPMLGQNTGYELRDFRARLQEEQIAFIAGELAVFSEPLMPRSSGVIGFGLVIPPETPADRYIGDMAISAAALASPHIVLTQPLGGETFHAGETVPINWQTTGDNLLIGIWFSPDGGRSWPVQIAENAADTGTYGWQIPNDPAVLSDQALVRVIATDPLGLYDTAASDAFTVAEATPPPTPPPSPTPTLSPSPTPSPTSGGGGGGGGGGAESTPTPTPTTTPTPTPPAAPTVTVLAPSAGAYWQIGDTFSIAWEATGQGVTITIQYSVDGGQSWPVTVVQDTGNTGLYEWTIPFDEGLISETAVIRVIATDEFGASAMDTSDSFYCAPPTK